jgi:hypothetical protein
MLSSESSIKYRRKGQVITDLVSNQNRETHREPVKVRDASSGIQTRFKIYCNCAPGDNPSQSETSGHIGGKGNHPCRKCEFGGTQISRESNAEFHASFSVSLICGLATLS